jgi:hypothetical protein
VRGTGNEYPPPEFADVEQAQNVVRVISLRNPAAEGIEMSPRLMLQLKSEKRDERIN